MKRNVKQKMSNLSTNSEVCHEFSMEELELSIKEMKTGKASGVDGIYIEFLKY